jgi:hypothetical protein
MPSTDEDGVEIELLRAELREVRRELAELQAALRDARQHIDLTMRGQTRCRACGCRKIAHAPEVLDRSNEGREAMAIFQPSVWSSKVVGHLEAYVCTRCGAVEWWVKDPSTLKAHERFLRIIDGAPGDPSPFR